jgi:glycosyltransferase involved in cell wall biosynthesis
MITTHSPLAPREAVTKNVAVLSEAIRQAGHEIEVFPLFNSSTDYAKFVSSSNPFSPFVFQLRESQRIERQIRKFQPDSLSTHFGLLGTNLIISNRIKKPYSNNVTFVYSYPNSVIESFRIGKFSYIPRIFLNNSQIYKKTLLRSPNTVFTSKPLFDEFERFSSRSTSLAMAISNNEIKESKRIMKERSNYRQKWGLHEDEIVLGFLGHPTSVKGLELVVGSFIELERKYRKLKGKKLKLLLASSELGQLNLGKILSPLPTSVREQILTMGYVSSLEFIGVIDLLLFPLRSHIGTTAMPRTVIEALLVCTPIIVGAVNPTIEDISAKTLGVTAVFPNQDVLTEAIQGVLEENEQVRRTLTKDREQIINQHRADQLVSNLINFIS